MDNIDYLLDSYYNKEEWRNSWLDERTIRNIYKRQIDNDNIAFLEDKDGRIGYLEIYRLDSEQVGNVISGNMVDSLSDNLVDGDFVFVSSAYIEPEHRNAGNLKKLIQIMKDKQKNDYVGVIYEDGNNPGNFSFYKKGEI